ncbi:MAG TPA: GlsB/YeaQ/YmgE family stress response membrane protein [Actinomycetota bacterium]|nr:GlsB/YeaQ/YmgE family stress response membrane protein [Actinomycetota bacterium]
MELIWFILTLLVTGLIAGGLARLILPGREKLGVLGTSLVSVAGAFLGGFVGRLLLGSLEWRTSLLFAVAGAIVLLIPFSMRAGRPVSH